MYKVQPELIRSPLPFKSCLVVKAITCFFGSDATQKRSCARKCDWIPPLGADSSIRFSPLSP